MQIVCNLISVMVEVSDDYDLDDEEDYTNACADAEREVRKLIFSDGTLFLIESVEEV